MAIKLFSKEDEIMMKRITGLFMAAVGAYLIAGAGVAAAGDHLKCYKVRDKSPLNRVQVDPANKYRPVITTSNTGLNPESCTVDNRRAKICCDAVEKDGGPPTGDTIHNRFCCYKLKCPNPQPNTAMSVNDQFRSGVVDKLKPSMLCAPG